MLVSHCTLASRGMQSLIMLMLRNMLWACKHLWRLSALAKGRAAPHLLAWKCTSSRSYLLGLSTYQATGMGVPSALCIIITRTFSNLDHLAAFVKEQAHQLLCLCRPLHRGTIAEQLHRAGLARQSHRPLRRFFGATARYLAAGVAFYVVATYAAGGQSRIRSDVDRLQVGCSLLFLQNACAWHLRRPWMKT